MNKWFSVIPIYIYIYIDIYIYIYMYKVLAHGESTNPHLACTSQRTLLPWVFYTFIFIYKQCIYRIIYNMCDNIYIFIHVYEYNAPTSFASEN